jgi:hypothetical protein
MPKRRRGELDDLASTTGPDGRAIRREQDDLSADELASSAPAEARPSRAATTKARTVMDMALAAGAYDESVAHRKAPSSATSHTGSSAAVPDGSVPGGLVLPRGWRYKQRKAPPGEEGVAQPFVWLDPKAHVFDTFERARGAIERYLARQESAEVLSSAGASAAAAHAPAAAAYAPAALAPAATPEVSGRSARAAGQAAAAKATRIAAAEAANSHVPLLAVERPSGGP